MYLISQEPLAEGVEAEIRGRRRGPLLSQKGIELRDPCSLSRSIREGHLRGNDEGLVPSGLHDMRRDDISTPFEVTPGDQSGFSIPPVVSAKIEKDNIGFRQVLRHLRVSGAGERGEQIVDSTGNPPSPQPLIDKFCLWKLTGCACHIPTPVTVVGIADPVHDAIPKNHNLRFAVTIQVGETTNLWAGLRERGKEGDDRT